MINFLEKLINDEKCLDFYSINTTKMSNSFLVYILHGSDIDFSVSPSPHGTSLGFELCWTGLGLGLRGLGNKGLETGLDNKSETLLGERERETDRQTEQEKYAVAKKK